VSPKVDAAVEEAERERLYDKTVPGHAVEGRPATSGRGAVSRSMPNDRDVGEAGSGARPHGKQRIGDGDHGKDCTHGNG
jgi:hypothetical protein